MTKTARMDSVTLAHHLRVVGERYEQDAQNLRDNIEALTADPATANPVQARGLERLLKQFIEQAQQVRDFSDALDNGYMKVDGDLLLVLPG